MPRSCVHELDRVRLLVDTAGWDAGFKDLTVPAGAVGTVVSEAPGAKTFLVEVVDQESGETACFFEATKDQLTVVRVRGGVRAA